MCVIRSCSGLAFMREVLFIKEIYEKRVFVPRSGSAKKRNVS